jgi:putative ATP-dependent endonuclease of OLD family
VKLRRLQIENFRGIEKLDLELGDTTVLIGENNTGKTTVLEALRFALDLVKTRRVCIFGAYDFHLPNATAGPSSSSAISIRLKFSEDSPGEWGEGLSRLNREKILQVEANGCASVTLKVGARFDVLTNDFVQDWEFQNIDGLPLAGISEGAIGKLKSEVSFVYLDALRDDAKHFDAKGPFWRPFLKESQLTPEKQGEIEAKLDEVNRLIISSHASFSQVLARLKEVGDVVPMAGGDFVTVDAVPGRLFDMLSKAQVTMNGGTGAKIPLGRHGEGTQSLAVLMLFNAYLQTWNKGSPIVALEEPEAHLHPSAVRALWRVIEKIPGQKIISTHSGDLLAEVPYQHIVRFALLENKIKAWPLGKLELDEKRSHQFNFHVRRTRGELFYARCWILGEGESEIILLQEIARLRNVNLELLGIRCVGYRGSDIGLFLSVADEMGLPWVVLTDNDVQGQDTIKKVREKLNGRSEHRTLFVTPQKNIECYLCAHGFGDVYENLLTYNQKEQIPLKTDPVYWEKVTDTVKKIKIEAIHRVIDEIRKGRAIPRLLINTIVSAKMRAKAL